MATIVVGIPTYEGHAQYLPQLLDSLGRQTVAHQIFFANTSQDPSFQHQLEATGHRIIKVRGCADRKERIAAGRNAVREAFLATDATHLCWVDTDITLAPDAMERLLADDREVVSGAYLSPYYIDGKLTIAPVAFSTIPDQRLGMFIPFSSLFTNAVLRMRAVGFGICMVKRQVVEEIPIREHDGVNGEDFLFCKEADERGYAINLDTRVWAKHHVWPLGDQRNEMLDIELQGRRAGLLR